MSDWRWWAITFGGSGAIKPAPGTWGSLAATIVLFALHAVVPPSVWPIVPVGFLLIATCINVALGGWAVRTLGEDPGSCVIDEAAGIALTLIALPLLHPTGAFALAFLTFRFFDITKIPPARQMEKLPLGWGILLDDLAAAVYANLVCQIILRSI